MKRQPPDPHEAEGEISSEPANGPRSAIRIVKLLRAVADASGGVTLGQLSVDVGAPKTSVLALLRALSDGQYLQSVEGRYHLGRAAFALGSAIVARRRFPDSVLPLLRELAAASGETAFISELLPDEAVSVYVARAESAHPIRFMAEIGEKRQLYSSSGGRVLLAFQPEEWQERYIARTKLVAHTPKTATDKGRLRALLNEIRETGISRTHEDVHEGVSAFASPIKNGAGQVIAALALAAPTSRASAASDRLTALVLQAASEMSHLQGFDEGRTPERR